MKNLLSHLIHITLITEFEVLFYIYYIVPYERDSIYKMFNPDTNIDIHSYNISKPAFCNDEYQRITEYNDKLVAICYYYIGGINALLLGAFIYDVYKVLCTSSLPRVLSSPKSWLPVIDGNPVPYPENSRLPIGQPSLEGGITMFPFEIEMVPPEPTCTSVKPVESENVLLKYWKQSRFMAKMSETLQLIMLLGIFEYLFFNYLFNKFRIVSAKLIACNLL